MTTAIHIQDGIGVSLVPPWNVATFWEFILPDLERSIEESHREVTAGTVRRMVQLGRWELWVVSEGEEYHGFAITEDIQTDRGTWVNIPFAGVDRSLRVLGRLLDAIEAYASEVPGVIGVKWISSRPEFAAFAKRRGYEPRFVEYVREI